MKELNDYSARGYDVTSPRFKDYIMILPGMLEMALKSLESAGYHYRGTFVSGLHVPDRFAAAIKPYSGKHGVGFAVYRNVDTPTFGGMKTRIVGYYTLDKNN